MVNQKIGRSTSFLPNAPLSEVVFELRWKLQGDQKTPPVFWTDPAYQILVSNFVPAAAKYGFKTSKKLLQEGMVLAAHSIGIRLYETEDQPFPLWQLGPGIFASNESAAYVWPRFKKLAIDGIKTLLSSYPPTKQFDIEPIHIELRYIDSFDTALVPDQDLTNFINANTSLRIDLPNFLKTKPIGKSPKASLLFEFPVSGVKNSHFSFLIANGTSKDKSSIILESKFITRSDSINFGKTTESRLQYISRWLEGAHSVTSPFFKQFISQSLMQEFQRPPNA